MKNNLSRRRVRLSLWLAGAASVAITMGGGAASATTFMETNLVTDSQSFLTGAGYSAAATVDPNLINPWGMDHTQSGAWFIANTGNEGSGSGKASGAFYTGAGIEQSSVIIPQTAVGAMGAGAPTGATGVVYNSSTSQFDIADLDGHISTLNFGATTSVQKITGPTPPMGPPHSIYTGVAVDTVGGTTYILGANNGTGSVDVYGPNFKQAAFGTSTFVANAFAAPADAAGLAPYNVQNIGGNIWVTYSIPGPGSANAPIGSGAVAEFAANGQLITSFTDPAHISSPWALAIAPSDFGKFAGDLLVGNFSHNDDPVLQDADINAYNPFTGAYVGTIDGSDGKPIQLPGLWQIEAGNDGDAGSSGNIYFTAGIGDEQHGLFGYLSPSAVPEPATWTILLMGFGCLGAAMRSTRRKFVTVV